MAVGIQARPTSTEFDESRAVIVAVTGLTGYVGRFVAADLIARGWQIRALVRPGSDRSGFSAPIDWIDGDLLTDPALIRLTEGVDAVIHLAYAHKLGKYRGGEGADLAGWLATNVNGSLRLLHAAQNAHVARFAFLSSRAVFSRTEPGRELDESHPTTPDTHYGAYKVTVEAFLQSFAHVAGMQTLSVRATGIYGATWPIERSKWWDTISAVISDQPVTAVRGGTEVYGGDVARVIGEWLTRPTTVAADTIHLSDVYVTTRDIVQLARRFAGRPGALPAVPADPPTNVLICRRLTALGLTLDGVPRLEATIAELVDAALSQAVR